MTAQGPTAGEKVSLSIACRSDLHPSFVKQYGEAVNFIAIWVKLHEADGTREGIPFDEVMRLFAENVSRCLVGETKGTG